MGPTWPTMNPTIIWSDCVYRNYDKPFQNNFDFPTKA